MRSTVAMQRGRNLKICGRNFEQEGKGGKGEREKGEKRRDFKGKMLKKSKNAEKE